MHDRSHAREFAIRILTAVLAEKRPLDELLESSFAEVPAELHSWLHDICAGTLRWMGRLELILDSVALKKKPSGWLRKLLLLSAYQIIAQEKVPAAKIVSEAVAQTKQRHGDSPARFVNACLRKIADHVREWREMKMPIEISEQSRWASLPEWIWARLVKQHGLEWAAAFAKSCLERPTTWVRVRSDLKVPWLERGEVEGSFRVVGGGAIHEKIGFAEGEFFVQDLSNQLLVAEISQILKANNKCTVLDMCASPGGKAVGMAWNGFNVTASDLDGPRFEMLKLSVNRLAPEVKLVKSSELSSEEQFDLVWVDAPCSATGIVRRHPDVKWMHDENELPDLISKQQELVTKGWSKVKEGGLLVYSVCSILEEEGTQAIEKNILSEGSAELLKRILLVPHEAPYGDGFWAVVIKKK
ncbi:MAG: transcription antitermination factor NusB [Bdellovibrionota bacterium]